MTLPVAGFAAPPQPADLPAGWNLHTLEALKDELRRTPQVHGLAHAWQLAQQHDPQYQMALSELRAAQTQRAQGRARLLPQVEAGYYRGVIRGTRNILDAPPAQSNAELDYDSQNTYVQLQQPVLNYGRYAEYERAVALAELGEAQFKAQQHERLLVLADTYFRTLLAQERLKLDTALAESLKKQAAAQTALYERDEGSRIDAQETLARLALAEADVLRARDDLHTARRELQGLLGRETTQLPGLVAQFTPTVLSPAGLPAWMDLGRQQNAELQATRAQQRVADADVERARARHLPQLDLVANWSKADSENLSSLSQNTNTFSAGLSLSIPIFSGGYDTAANARARAIQRQTSQEIQAAVAKVEAEIVRRYTGVQSGVHRIQALQAAEKSGEYALAGATLGYQHGIASNVDILKQQENLYKTRHELVKSRFDYLLSLMQLWVAAGVLDDDRLRETDLTHLER